MVVRTVNFEASNDEAFDSYLNQYLKENPNWEPYSCEYQMENHWKVRLRNSTSEYYTTAEDGTVIAYKDGKVTFSINAKSGEVLFGGVHNGC